jgi:hypothetical protein
MPQDRKGKQSNPGREYSKREGTGENEAEGTGENEAKIHVQYRTVPNATTFGGLRSRSKKMCPKQNSHRRSSEGKNQAFSVILLEAPLHSNTQL